MALHFLFSNEIVTVLNLVNGIHAWPCHPYEFRYVYMTVIPVRATAIQATEIRAQNICQILEFV